MVWFTSAKTSSGRATFCRVFIAILLLFSFYYYLRVGRDLIYQNQEGYLHSVPIYNSLKKIRQVDDRWRSCFTSATTDATVGGSDKHQSRAPVCPTKTASDGVFHLSTTRMGNADCKIDMVLFDMLMLFVALRPSGKNGIHGVKKDGIM